MQGHVTHPPRGP
jgi:hypothetical protein